MASALGVRHGYTRPVRAAAHTGDDSLRPGDGVVETFGVEEVLLVHAETGFPVPSGTGARRQRAALMRREEPGDAVPDAVRVTRLARGGITTRRRRGPHGGPWRGWPAGGSRCYVVTCDEMIKELRGLELPTTY
ncbi:hypothetical protein MN0502_12610 [Arthrobacter sp. MN05-02]|nr:hypothetical protein MN0502_12610 [Arthrobacter sp. MN05-02]